MRGLVAHLQLTLIYDFELGTTIIGQLCLKATVNL